MASVYNAAPEKQERCFARRHMRPGDFALYSYALAVSQQSGVFYSDDRRDAEEFGEHGVSKNTVCESRGRLEDHDWFVRIDKGQRRKRNSLTGSWEPLRYHVLTHKEWIAKHPRRCRFPKPLVADFATGGESPVPNTGTGPVPNTGTGETAPVPNSDSTGPNSWVVPVPNSGTKEVKKERKEGRREEVLIRFAARFVFSSSVRPCDRLT